MDTKKHMILLKGEIKTEKVKFCRMDRNSRKWEVQFTNGKTYSYSFSNVLWLKEPEILNPEMYRISRAGHELYDI